MRLRNEIERELKQMASSVSDTQHRLENDEFAYTTARLRDDKDIKTTLDKLLGTISKHLPEKPNFELAGTNPFGTVYKTWQDAFSAGECAVIDEVNKLLTTNKEGSE